MADGRREKMSVGRYLATRVSTLVPPMNPAPNPFKTLTLLNRQQWIFFLVRKSSLILFIRVLGFVFVV
jgi:MFS transporter, SHS family, lactate transporter